MNTKHLLRPAALLLPLVILAGCPSVGNVPQAGGDWHNMGEANNGNFMLAVSATASSLPSATAKSSSI